MKKPSLADAPQVEPGGKILLLLGEYDPPTMDYFRTLEEATKSGKWDQVWICPCSSRPGKEVQEMCMILATEATAMLGKTIGCCLAGISKKLDVDGVVKWCRTTYPSCRFETAGFQDGLDVVARFASQPDPSHGRVMRMSNFLPVLPGIIQRIRDGRDESRNFCAGVWLYMQKNRMYRTSTTTAPKGAWLV